LVSNTGLPPILVKKKEKSQKKGKPAGYAKQNPDPLFGQDLDPPLGISLPWSDLIYASGTVATTGRAEKLRT